MNSRQLTPGIAFARAARFEHIISVLVKHGFGEILARIRVWEFSHIERRFLHHKLPPTELSVPERVRLALEELGPTFVKLGQVLSTRPDLVPPEIIFELKKLQASVNFISVDTVRSVIESELGQPISQLFDSFDDKPLAAGSLAQVHRAVLKGKNVVIKIERPNIVEITRVDLEIMHGLAGLAQRNSPAIYMINAVGLVEEFSEQLKKELDFRLEVTNMRRFAQDFRSDKTLRVPAPYEELCTKRVITMEYLDGISISDTQALVDGGYNLPLIVRRGAVLGFKSAFLHGFFHADPHPGNILVMPGNVIGLVDFGMMATLSTRDRERLAKLVYFIAEGDERRVARALNEVMESQDVISAEDMESSITDIIRDRGQFGSGDLPLAGALFGLMRTVMQHGGRLRPQLVWVTKSIAIQENIARSFHTTLNVMELGKPFARDIITRKLNPLRQPEELYFWLTDFLDTARDLPYDAGIIFHELRRGKIRIEFEHIGLEPIRQTINRVSNRMSLTIIIAALLVSSSVIVLARVAPTVGSIPVIAFIGYLIAGMLSILLALSVWFRSR